MYHTPHLEIRYLNEILQIWFENQILVRIRQQNFGGTTQSLEMTVL